MRSALFWDITRRLVVLFTDVSGQRIGPIFTGQESEKERKKASNLLGLLTREDGTDTLSQIVGKQLPHDAA
jgi:hypothetical protein